MVSEIDCVNGCGKKATFPNEFCSDKCMDDWFKKNQSEQESEPIKQEKKGNKRIAIMIFSITSALFTTIIFLYGHFYNSH